MGMNMLNIALQESRFNGLPAAFFGWPTITDSLSLASSDPPRAKSATCTQCRSKFEPKRSDWKFCSVACKQKAYRQRVTDKTQRTTRHDAPATRYGGDVYRLRIASISEATSAQVRAAAADLIGRGYDSNRRMVVDIGGYEVCRPLCVWAGASLPDVVKDHAIAEVLISRSEEVYSAVAARRKREANLRARAQEARR